MARSLNCGSLCTTEATELPSSEPTSLRSCVNNASTLNTCKYSISSSHTVLLMSLLLLLLPEEELLSETKTKSIQNSSKIRGAR